MQKQPKNPTKVIATNRRARFDFSFGEWLEAGLVLQGWEVKALRAGRAELVNAHIFIQKGEAFLTGARISPLVSTSTHLTPEPERVRKLLLHSREILRIQSAVQVKGNTCVPTQLYWKDNHVKCEIAIATGKKQHDKRATIREREWHRDRERLRKRFNR